MPVKKAPPAWPGARRHPPPSVPVSYTHLHPSAFVADNATVRGSVTLGANSSVFFGAVLRGDRAPITIGAGTNIQDNCVAVSYTHLDVYKRQAHEHRFAPDIGLHAALLAVVHLSLIHL